ncbi:hypothetical protein [Butyricimonas paravirosa]|uniref:hypothetical protein n=1 Tax=Butyricimonas paravirosa TaxID=1472417 RepID=UPI0022E2EE4D|nr:hypothetical protein [Butyricimonas paravirosa]
MDIFTLKRIYMELGEIVAIATVKQLNPSFDDVRYAEAAKLAGSRRWLKFHVKNGNIKPIRRGTAKNSPIYFSRYEIAALKKAEADIIAELI